MVSKTRQALRETGVKFLSISGGVAASAFIREKIIEMCDEEGVQVFIPDRKYCTDNATMIGAAAFMLYKNGEFSGLDVNASSHSDL